MLALIPTVSLALSQWPSELLPGQTMRDGSVIVPNVDITCTYLDYTLVLRKREQLHQIDDRYWSVWAT